jgi:hypothetical protein
MKATAKAAAPAAALLTIMCACEIWNKGAALKCKSIRRLVSSVAKTKAKQASCKLM